MNRSPLAVDASVAMKWVVAEEHSDRAQALLAASVRDRREIVGPPHLSGEVANAIYQRWRSADPAKHLTDDEARSALAAFLSTGVQSLMPRNLYSRALAFAQTHALPSLYDSLYVVLAQLAGIELWTADRRLLDALGTHAPWIRFIGDHPL